MATTTISMKMDNSLLEWVDGLGSNRSKSITGILLKAKAEMQSGRAGKPQPPKKRSMRDLMNEAILSRMSGNSDYINALSDEEFAKLVVARLPKEEAPSVEKEESILSLQACLETLPTVKDITKELSDSRSEIFALQCRLRQYAELEKYVKGHAELSEYIRTVFETAAEYVSEKVIRDGLPGLGEGGGLDEREKGEIKEQVRRMVERM